MDKLTVCTQTILRNADNLAVWLYFDRRAASGSREEKLSLLNGEIQSICSAHSSTLDDSMQRRMPRPNPTPRVFVEQGNELSRVLWLRWED